MRHVQPPLSSTKDTAINSAAQSQTNTSLKLQVITLFKAANVDLASYTFSNDLWRAWRVAVGHQTGMVGLKTGLISTRVAPFGGAKQSGLGLEGSRHGLEEHLETKYVCFGGV